MPVCTSWDPRSDIYVSKVTEVAMQEQQAHFYHPQQWLSGTSATSACQGRGYGSESVSRAGCWLLWQQKGYLLPPTCHPDNWGAMVSSCNSTVIRVSVAFKGLFVLVFLFCFSVLATAKPCKLLYWYNWGTQGGLCHVICGPDARKRTKYWLEHKGKAWRLSCPVSLAPRMGSWLWAAFWWPIHLMEMLFEMSSSSRAPLPFGLPIHGYFLFLSLCLVSCVLNTVFPTCSEIMV